MSKKSNAMGKIGLLLITMLLCFQSNSASAQIEPKKPLRFHKDHSPHGLVIGSITFPKEKAKYNGYIIHFKYKDSIKKVSRKNSTRVIFSPDQVFKMKHDGDINNGLTYIFAIERPVGKYEIRDIGLYANYGAVAFEKPGTDKSYSIPFDVNKGEITYVGNILFNEYAEENDTVMTLDNNFDRDRIIRVLKRKEPMVDWDKAIVDPNRKIEYDIVKKKED